MSSSLQRRFGSLTPEEASRLDAAAAELGVDIGQLMEVAGFQVARCAWRMLGRRAARVHVVAGHGHNGGDGLVTARHLAGWGCEVTAGVLGDPDSLDALLHQQCAAATGAGVAVRVSQRPADVLGRLDGSAIIIDALLGTGLRQPPRPAYAEVIAGLRGIILSIDVPSGLDAGTGTAPGVVVRARTTCTLAGMKRGLWNDAARASCGEIVVADIGIPERAWLRCGLTAPTSLRGGRLVTLRR
jgi:ADP-dependent NAD(P)H-hydrate dehydratase / NAD(P)H-hydrate epimerase